MAQFRMRLNEIDDKDVLDWLERQTDKTQAVKDAIRQAIGQVQDQNDGATVDLLAIRQVFESVLDEKMQGLTFNTTKTSEDKELENKLDALF